MKNLKAIFSRTKPQDFWALIDLLDWNQEGDDKRVVEPIVAYLATRSVKEIQDFQETLAQKLYDLDGKVWAKRSGSMLWRDNELVSADGFLYARCAVVANGKDFYEHVLSDPMDMPKDVEFEALIYIAGEALKRKTGDDAGIDTKTSFETYANHGRWS